MESIDVLWVVVAAAVGLLCVAAWRLVVVQRRLRGQVELVARAHDELLLQQAREHANRDRFLVEIVAAREEEARRVAGLLHDDAVQQLTALGLRLELAERRTGAPEIGRLAGEAREITRSLRRLMTELYPAALESQGLAAAVDVAAKSLREQGVGVHVTPCEERASHEREAVAYRVIVEALSNVGKHACASQVAVEVSVDDALRCEVRDDGLGFDTSLAESAPSHGSLGLHLARERIESAGGRLFIHSAAGRGTTLGFELPLGVGEARSGAPELVPA